MTQTTKNHVFHFRRFVLFGVLFAAFFIVRTDAGALPSRLTSGEVLAYATEMSPGGLLSGTNAARATNGLAPLTLDSQLNSSAQAKAQDMATKDYWAHVSPDGTEPWYFFNQAGYSYAKAGENLAYGFMTSQAAVDGWMNSASHRANILGEYYDVGFGIVNAPNYQSSGEQTIVVAHYGVKAMAAAPAPIAPASTPEPAPAPTPATPAPEPAAPVEAKQSPPPANEDKPAAPAAVPIPATATPVQTGDTSRVSILGMIANRSLPIAGLISLVMVSIAITGYALTHRSAFQQAVHAGEHFVVKHPGVDAGIVAAMTSLILLTTYGTIG